MSNEAVLFYALFAIGEGSAGLVGGLGYNYLIAKTPSWTNFATGAVVTMVALPVGYWTWFELMSLTYHYRHPTPKEKIEKHEATSQV